MINILFIHETLEINGGAEVNLYDLIDLLPVQGYTTHLIAVQEVSTSYIIEEYNNKDKKMVSKNNLFKFLENLINVKNINIIHIHSLSNPYFISTLFNFNIPVIRSMHEPRMICPGHGKFLFNSQNICEKKYGLHCFASAYLNKCAPRNPIRLLQNYKNTDIEVKQFSKQYHKTIVMSGYMKKEAIKTGFQENKLIKIPYLTRIKKSKIYKEDHNTINILFVGRFIEYKGILILLKSIIDILKINKNVKLHLVGDGYLLPQVKQIISDNGLIESVILHGWKSNQDLIPLYQMASFVVFPSIYPEAFGIVGIEAFAMQKPVIAFNVGGVSDWLDNDINGILIEDHFQENLSKAISELINNKQKLKLLSKNAYDTYLKKYTEKIIIPQYIKLYKDAITDNKN